MSDQIFRPSDADQKQRAEAYQLEQQRVLRDQIREEAHTQAIERSAIMDAANFRASKAIMGGATLFAGFGVTSYLLAYALHLYTTEPITNFILFQGVGLAFLLVGVFVGLTAMSKSPVKAIIWNWAALGTMFLLGAGIFVVAIDKALKVGII